MCAGWWWLPFRGVTPSVYDELELLLACLWKECRLWTTGCCGGDGDTLVGVVAWLLELVITGALPSSWFMRLRRSAMVLRRQVISSVCSRIFFSRSLTRSCRDSSSCCSMSSSSGAVCS